MLVMTRLSGHLISFLLFIVVFGCPYIEARQGKVFTNLVDVKNYIENNNAKVYSVDLLESPSPSPSPSPVVNEISFAPSSPSPFETGTVPAPAPAPTERDIAPAPLEGGIPQAPLGGFAPAPVEGDNAYGLGRDYNSQIFSKKTSYSVDLVNDEEEIPRDEFQTKSSREFNSGESYKRYGNNNGYYSTSNTINGHPNSFNGGNGYVQRQGLSDTRFLENGKYYYDVQNEKNYNNQNGYESVKKSGGNEGYYDDLKSKNEFENGYVQRQGMSDTRFMENGKYYYDVQNEKNLNNQNGYESVTKNGDNEGFYGDKSKNEFDNAFVQRQGLSDTRFLDNGKYYYDVQNENYNNQNGYESLKQSGHNEGYYGDKSNYEFDTTEGYERQQGYYVP